jgi:hypothetical protein
VDLNLVNIEDVPATNEAIRRLISLGQEEMLDAERIRTFDYRPPALESEATPGGGEARLASEDAEAISTAQSPL